MRTAGGQRRSDSNHSLVVRDARLQRAPHDEGMVHPIAQEAAAPFLDSFAAATISGPLREKRVAG